MFWTTKKNEPTVAIGIGVYKEKDLEQVRTCWWTLFTELLYNLTDYELSAAECKRRVELAAELTDAALEQFESRWGVRRK